MWRALSILLIVWSLALPVSAQEDTLDDPTWIEDLLQESLSGEGRAVKVTGFAGALSSRATMDQLTVSDDDGVWLSLEEAELNWTRTALLRGNLKVDELSAKRIVILRAPNPPEGLSTSDAQAGKFSLPELPVSVEIKKLNIEEVQIAPEIIGEPVTLKVDGQLQLASGEGGAELSVQRLERDDRLNFSGGFSNLTRVLSLDLDFSEAEGGLISTLIGVPGAPSLGLTIKGEAPISDYSAHIALSSDELPRFAGQVQVQQAEDAPEDAGYRITANLGGDVRPLFPADLHPFFGRVSRLSFSGLTHPDGRLALENLSLSSGALNLAGSLALAAGGWPESFDLSGTIAQDQTRVRLPIRGPDTSVQRAEITATFDAARGDVWTADMIVDGFIRAGVAAERAKLTGEGRIGRAPDTSVSGRFDYALTDLTLADPAMMRAAGPNPAGSASFGFRPSEPLRVAPLTLTSGDINMNAGFELDDLTEGLILSGAAQVETSDLSRFDGLLGRPLSGEGSIGLTGTATLLTGAFDIQMSAQTRELDIAEPRLARLIRLETDLTVDAFRDETGTTLRSLRLTNDAAQIALAGRLDLTSGELELDADLDDIALLEPRLSGSAEAQGGIAWQEGAPLRLSDFTARVGATQVAATGEVNTDDPKLPASGRLSVQSPDLSRLSRLVNMPLSGQADLAVEGSGLLAGDMADITFNLDGRNLGIGAPSLDNLIAGTATASGSVALDPSAPLDLRQLTLDTPRLRMAATGAGAGRPITLSARLSDLALVVPDVVSGPAEANGTLTILDRTAERMTLNLSATGPGGITAQVTGAVEAQGKRLALDLTGNAPLQLANPIIEPNLAVGDVGFDLAMNGAPELSSLTGTVTVDNGRVSLPELDYVVEGISGGAQLQGGQANIDVSGNTGTSGRFVATGPVSLDPPFNANISTRLDALGMTDNVLYETTVNGTVTVTGPLRTGATIGGQVDLGTTELRVPSGSGVTIGTLPDLAHVGEPAAVNRTRQRAGLTGEKAKRGPSFPLNLTINAPNRIFVRGRGLDAELGGSVRLGGTTQDVQASGVFDLIRGRLDILGKRLTLTEGLVNLQGSLDPYLRFLAEATAGETEIFITLEGLASEPEVTFTSSPSLPQEEVIARLLFGRSLNSISPFQAAQLVNAAATLSGNYSGGLAGNLRSSLGLSDLDLTTTDEGTAALSAGAYLSDNIYSQVTADSDGKQEINLNLDLSDTITIKGRADNEGETGIGIFFEKDY